MQITSGFLNSRKIKTPPQKEVRPTLSKVRSGIFNSLKTIINFETATFLDLFAGSGIMSFEAISRGFGKVITIEKNFKVYKIIEENYKELDVKGSLIKADATNFIEKNKEKIDVMYIDPPFQSDLYDKILALAFKNTLYDNTIIIVEAPKDKALNIENYDIIKEKKYSDISIIFIQKKFIHDNIYSKGDI